MSTKIKHAGIIISTQGTTAQVRITQSSACSSCQVATRCSASESKEKIIDAHNNLESLKAGDKVLVSTSIRNGRMAVLLCFVFPVLLLLATLIVAKWQHVADELAALWTIGGLIPYYIIIWLFREKIASRMVFIIEEPFVAEDINNINK